VPFHRNEAGAAEQQAETTQQSSATHYNLFTFGIQSNVNIQNTRTKLWDIYGVITAISPKQRYCIKTSTG